MLLFAGKVSKRNSSVSVDSPGSGHPWARSSLDGVIPERSYSKGVLEWACYAWAAPLPILVGSVPKDHPLVSLLLRSLYNRQKFFLPVAIRTWMRAETSQALERDIHSL